MSKPTHILIPIEEYNRVEFIGTYNDHRKALIKLIDSSPNIDLSEEGIKQKAKKISDMYDSKTYEIYEHGYRQCAKDLLNTKS